MFTVHFTSLLHHRIIEQLELERTLRTIQFQCSAISRKTFQQDRLLTALSNLASTASLGILCQSLIAFQAKNFFLTLNLNLSYFNLKPSSLFLSLHIVGKSLSSFICVHFKYGRPFRLCPGQCFYCVLGHRHLKCTESLLNDLSI